MHAWACVPGAHLVQRHISTLVEVVPGAVDLEHHVNVPVDPGAGARDPCLLLLALVHEHVGVAELIVQELRLLGRRRRLRQKQSFFQIRQYGNTQSLHVVGRLHGNDNTSGRHPSSKRGKSSAFVQLVACREHTRAVMQACSTAYGMRQEVHFAKNLAHKARAPAHSPSLPNASHAPNATTTPM